MSSRCAYLLMVLDMGGSEARDPLDDLAALRKELELYSPELAARPWCIVANKMDMPDARQPQALQGKHKGVTILPVCAELGEGIPELKAFLQEKVEEEEAQEEARKEALAKASRDGVNPGNGRLCEVRRLRVLENENGHGVAVTGGPGAGYAFRSLRPDQPITSTPFPNTTRRGGIRTRASSFPNEALYQAEPRPDGWLPTESSAEEQFSNVAGITFARRTLTGRESHGFCFPDFLGACFSETAS